MNTNVEITCDHSENDKKLYYDESAVLHLKIGLLSGHWRSIDDLGSIWGPLIGGHCVVHGVDILWGSIVTAELKEALYIWVPLVPLSLKRKCWDQFLQSLINCFALSSIHFFVA